LGDIVSGWGNKLVTLKSPKIKIEGETRPHPKTPSGKPVHDTKKTDKKPVKPPIQPESTKSKGKPQGDYGDGKGPKTNPTTDKKGLPVKEVTNDQVKFDFLGGYTGEKITEEDYNKAAKSIGCEVAFIKAVAKIETGNRKSGFDEKKRPVILYERHVFARCTDPINKYNNTNPDISSTTGYIAASLENQNLVKAGKLSKDQLYGYSYTRLAKAYSLDKNAALKACSWGKFQVLGENYKEAGFKTVLSYVQTMCISEREHLKAVVNFINADQIRRNAAIKKDWATFARKYNGKRYKKNKYDIKLKEAYKKICKTNPL
jgi:hypothetical protein